MVLYESNIKLNKIIQIKYKMYIYTVILIRCFCLKWVYSSVSLPFCPSKHFQTISLLNIVVLWRKFVAYWDHLTILDLLKQVLTSRSADNFHTIKLLYTVVFKQNLINLIQEPSGFM